MIRWAYVSNQPEQKRFEVLSEAIAAVGVENQVDFIDCGEDELAAKFPALTSEYDQLRFGGTLCAIAPSLTERMPSLMMTLKAADSFTKEKDGQWWPRNFFYDGLTHALVTDVKAIDLGGAVFLLGAGCEAYVLVAALARAGFQRFSVSDPDDDRGQDFIDDVRTAYFNLQFQCVPRHLITQLPSVHSVAVNTLVPGRDDGALGELVYFNFLQPGGLWLDLPLEGNPTLAAEALAVGAVVESGARVAAWTDKEWAQQVLGVRIDVDALAKRYSEIHHPSPPTHPEGASGDTKSDDGHTS